MPDEVIRVHLKKHDLLVVSVLCAQTARRARELQGLMPTSAGLLAEAFAAGFGIAALLAGQARINLQLTCDGPLGGLFVDADAQGRGRGYVKNSQVNFLTAGGSFDASGALGREGMLSVVRELRVGEFYRSSIALDHFDLARDLERYYRESEQLETAVVLEVTPDGPERLGRVGALLVQAMPEANPGMVERARALLQLEAPFPPGATLRAYDLIRPLADQLGGEADVLADYPLSFLCDCSTEKVFSAVLAMGRSEIEDMLHAEGRAVATCAFCNTVYEVSGEQLRRMLE